MSVPLAAVLAVLCAAPAAAQEANRRDERRAERLAAADKDFRTLPEDEKQAVIRHIAAEIHGRRRRAVSADIRTLRGESVDQLRQKASRSAAYEVVLAEQDKEAVAVPGATTLETKHLDTDPYGRLFADNEWEVLAGSPEAEALKRSIDKITDMIKKLDGRLASMHVESSASTLRNRGKAESLTHLELSKRRAEAAAAFARDYLKTKGLDLDDDRITLDFEGANKNGTSGPSSPFPVAAGDDPKFNPKGSCEAPAKIKELAAKGPGMTPADRLELAKVYDPHKYVQLTFDAVFEVKGAKPATTEPGEAHLVSVNIDYKERPHLRVPRVRLPSLRVRWPFGNREKRMARRQWKCPKF
jgi:hypothetical protein